MSEQEIALILDDAQRRLSTLSTSADRISSTYVRHGDQFTISYPGRKGKHLRAGAREIGRGFDVWPPLSSSEAGLEPDEITKHFKALRRDMFVAVMRAGRFEPKGSSAEETIRQVFFDRAGRFETRGSSAEETIRQVFLARLLAHVASPEPFDTRSQLARNESLRVNALALAKLLEGFGPAEESVAEADERERER